MAGGWKNTLFKALLLLHIVLLPAAVLLWGKGYVGLVRHLHEGVVYEITSIVLVGPFRWFPRFDRLWEEIFLKGAGIRSVTETIRITMNDPPEPGIADHLLIIWGERLEEKFRDLQPPEALSSLAWLEGVEHTGNREPILIAYGTAEVENEWALREDPNASTFYGRAVLSQRVYNLERLWLIFYGISDSAGRPVVPIREPVLWQWYKGHKSMEIITPMDPVELLERLSAYRPGVIPVDYRLEVATMYKPGEFWFPMPRGGRGLPFLLVGFIFYVVTAPYRILFFLPLMLSPRILVWPVAVLWAMLWIAGWAWSMVACRRLR